MVIHLACVCMLGGWTYRGLPLSRLHISKIFFKNLDSLILLLLKGKNKI